VHKQQKTVAEKVAAIFFLIFFILRKNDENEIGLGSHLYVHIVMRIKNVSYASELLWAFNVPFGVAGLLCAGRKSRALFCTSALCVALRMCIMYVCFAAHLRVL